MVEKIEEQNKIWRVCLALSFFLHLTVFLLSITKAIPLPEYLKPPPKTSENRDGGVLLEFEATEEEPNSETPFVNRVNARGEGSLTKEQGVQLDGPSEDLRNSVLTPSFPSMSSPQAIPTPNQEKQGNESKKTEEIKKTESDESLLAEMKEGRAKPQPDYTPQEILSLFSQYSKPSFRAISENSLFYKFNLGTEGPPKLASRAHKYFNFLNELKNALHGNLTTYVNADPQKNFYLVKGDKVAVLAEVTEDGVIRFKMPLQNSTNNQPFMEYLVRGVVENASKISPIPPELIPMGKKVLLVPISLEFQERPTRQYWLGIY